MIFDVVQVASFIGFVETPWKRVSAANACVSHNQTPKQDIFGDMAKHLWYGTIIESTILVLSILIVLATDSHSGMYIAIILHFPSSLAGIYFGEVLSSGFGDTGAILCFLAVILLQVFVFVIIIKAISRVRNSTSN